MRRFSWLVILVLIVTNAQAQSTNATITGRVTDPGKAVLPGAKVTLINAGTNVARSATTDAAGSYVLTNVPPADYRLQIEKEGFKSVIKPGVVVHVQDNLEINFELALGAVSESVTVTGGAPLVNTQSAAVSTVVDQTFVKNIPLNGRSFQDLISLTPGVVTQNPNRGGAAGSAGDFSVNGQRTESNIYTVDGVSANTAAGTGTGNLNQLSAASGSVPAATALGTTQPLVSVDALQEFRVQSSTYSAEYGRGPGGQFSLVTRSGTNDIHGSAFDYVRNDRFDVNDWFNHRLGKPKPPLRQNDFGGTLGGPIRKDTAFFFVSYEGLRLTQPQAATIQLVPDSFMRQQAPAALQPILNAFPVQNGMDLGTAANPGLAQFIQAYSLPRRLSSTSVRLDETLGARVFLFFRFASTPSTQDNRSLSVLTRQSFDSKTYTLGSVGQLSNTATNDFRIGYAQSDAKQQAKIDTFGGATPVDLSAAFGSASKNGTMQIQIIIPGQGFAVLNATSAIDRLRQRNLVDAFSFARGNHQIKAGIDYRRVESPTTPGSPLVIPGFQNAQQVLTNKPAFVAVLDRLNATPIFNEYAAFIQDAWLVRPNVNLSLGVRWEADPAPHGANGLDAYTVLGDVNDPKTWTLAPRGTPLWRTSWLNFAPRLSIAWTVRDNPGRETVLRAGGGVYYDTNNQVATSGFQGLGFSATTTYTGVSLPLTPAQINLTPSVSPPYNTNAYVFPQDLKLPYTIQWNVSMQQALGTNQAITLSYVGAGGRRMPGQNPLLRIGSVNPQFTNVTLFTTGLTSDYKSVQAQFQRSLSHSVNALTSYTWSHCRDFGSAYSAISTRPGIGSSSFSRGNCDSDVRHNLQGGVSWDLPGINANRFAQDLLNHWGLDTRVIARTSYPVALFGGGFFDPTTGLQYQPGPNLVPNQPLYIYGSQFPGGRSINPAAFCSASSPSCSGSPAPRNLVRGFGAWQINMALRREFPIAAGFALQFRAEVFNLLNHTNFGTIDNSVGSPTFGQAIRMLNQSLPTLASQYQQGGPRSMQFALRLLF